MIDELEKYHYKTTTCMTRSRQLSSDFLLWVLTAYLFWVLELFFLCLPFLLVVCAV